MLTNVTKRRFKSRFFMPHLSTIRVHSTMTGKLCEIWTILSCSVDKSFKKPHEDAPDRFIVWAEIRS